MDGRERMHELVDELCDLAVTVDNIESYLLVKTRAKIRFNEVFRIWNEMYDRMHEDNN